MIFAYFLLVPSSSLCCNCKQKNSSQIPFDITKESLRLQGYIEKRIFIKIFFRSVLLNLLYWWPSQRNRYCRFGVSRWRAPYWFLSTNNLRGNNEEPWCKTQQEPFTKISDHYNKKTFTKRENGSSIFKRDDQISSLKYINKTDVLFKFFPSSPWLSFEGLLTINYKKLRLLRFSRKLRKWRG